MLDIGCNDLSLLNVMSDYAGYRIGIDPIQNNYIDTQNVNTHQLNSYHLTMKNKAETLTQGSSQPEVFNVLGQLQSIERIKKENGQLEYDKKDKLTHELGAKPE